MSDEFTSGEIATAVKDASSAPASPAAQPSKDPASSAQPPRTAADASTTTTDDSRYKGWIPPDAHERVVDGFHKRLDELGWARGLNPDEVRDAITHFKAAQKAAQSSPPQFRALVTEDGVRLESKEEAEWNRKQAVADALAQLKAELDPRLAPMESDRAQREHDAKWVRDTESIAHLPGLTKDEDWTPMVTYATELNQRRRNGEPIPEFTARQLYDAVILPKLAASRDAIMAEAKQAVLADMNNTSRRRTEDVNPGKVPAGSRKADRDKSFQELLEEEFSKAKTA